MVGAKRRKVSKNKKKNWKHSDIKDVEEYLDNVRLQERTGGLLAEKKDADIFVLDKKASAPVDIAELRRKKKLPKQLKCHALLLPDPHTKPAGVTLSVKKIDPQNEKLKRKYQKKITRSNRTKAEDTNTYDLWNDDHLADKESKKIDEIDEGHFSRITKRRRVKAPTKFLDKPYKSNAVEVPHSGMSYNPTYEDHQDLLQDALEVELKKERAEKRVTRALDEKFPSRQEAPTEKSYLKEMSAGLEGAESEGSDSEEESDGDQMPVAQPVRNNKKTQAQRNKEKRLKQLEAQKQKQKEANMKKNEFYRLKSIKKELAVQEEKSMKRQFRKALKGKKKEEGTLRLGYKRFETPDLELKLSHEVEGSLRLLKPEGSLFDDRFKSLQKRNMIEPRLRAKATKAKYKPKKFEKKGHKTVTL